MTLRTRFNSIIGLTLLAGAMAMFAIAKPYLDRHAIEAAATSARLLMDTATAIREYTVEEVNPIVREVRSERFLPQSVPSYAATQTLLRMAARHPEYSYREAVINPTNPQDRAVPWETEVITRLKANPTLTEVVETRQAGSDTFIYFARPIVVSDSACLGCHGSPLAAPRSLLAAYGDSGGFGWQMKEVVGAQFVSVPTRFPLEAADRALLAFMLVYLAAASVAMLVLNRTLSRSVIRPIEDMAKVATAASLGASVDLGVERPVNDEIGELGDALRRMLSSVEHAKRMLSAHR